MTPLLITSVMQTKGFELKEGQKNQVSQVLDRIRSSAPRDATIRGSLKKESQLIEGRLRISSKAGVFFAKARAKNVYTLMLKLQARLVRQLLKLKKNRFSKQNRWREVGELTEPKAS